jgi:hypothetical protein
MWLRELVNKVLINPIIRTRTRQFRQPYHPTPGSIKKQIVSLLQLKYKLDPVPKHDATT